MYVISNTSRVYITLFLFLCTSLFSAAALANWSVNDYLNSDRILRDYAAGRGVPSDSYYSASGASDYSSSTRTGATSSGSLVKGGGVMPTTVTKSVSNSVLRGTLGGALRGASGGILGMAGGAAIGLGIQAFLDEEGAVIQPDGSVKIDANNLPYDPSQGYNPSNPFLNYCVQYSDTPCAGTPEKACQNAYKRFEQGTSPTVATGYSLMNASQCQVFDSRGNPSFWVWSIAALGSCSSPNYYNDVLGCVPEGTSTPPPNWIDYEPTSSDLEKYNPQPSDLATLNNGLSQSDFSYDVSIQSATSEGPVKTTYDASGNPLGSSQSSTTYTPSVTNNGSSSPTISITESTTIKNYNSAGDLTGSTTDVSVGKPLPSPNPSSNPSPSPIDFELPSFCSWASIVCDWIGWTKESITGEEPDLINLISEFEPDDNQYESSIGSGSCPGPISLYVHIINRTVEVSYQPFCDFLDMIRPLVIAGAWLLSAFMYVGVLRRG